MTWPLDSEPMWELGRFMPRLKPVTYTNHYQVERKIKDQFKNWMDERVDVNKPWSLDPEIRSPLHEWAINRPNQRFSWHHDGSTLPAGSRGYLVAWSNGLGTEITEDGHKIWHEPGTVLVFDNRRFTHRTPLTRGRKDVKNRWFARICLGDSLRTNIKDVPGVFGLTTW